VKRQDESVEQYEARRKSAHDALRAALVPQTAEEAQLRREQAQARCVEDMIDLLLRCRRYFTRLVAAGAEDTETLQLTARLQAFGHAVSEAQDKGLLPDRKLF
jgi:hypothetical protein